MALVSMSQYQITRNNQQTTEVVVAESLTKAAEAATEQPNSLHTIRQVASGIMVDKPLRTVEFVTAVLTEEAAVAGCKAYPTSFTKEEEQTCIFEAVAAEGWQFVDWTKDGVSLSTEPLVELEITAPTEPTALRSVYTANFLPM